MTKKLKVGVVGVGHLGKEHARIYAALPEADLIGICDQDPAKEDKAKELGTAYFKDFRDLISNIDCVSIATPTSTHFEIAKEFLKAGIHTLIEKPITLKLEEADELIDLAGKHNCSLQVGHIERHNPGFRRVQEIAKNIRFFEIHRSQSCAPWYMMVGATMCSPMLIVSKTAEMAAIPDENSLASRPWSNLAASCST